MTVSDELFKLIGSLSKSEKIYFKKFSSLFLNKDSSNYLKLFNEIDRQSAAGNKYDEKRIHEKEFSGKFIKNISVHKNYLYNMILTSLVIHKKINSDAILIRHLISQSEILIDKTLYQQALKVIQRAKKLCVRNELNTAMYEILNLEKQVMRFTKNYSEIVTTEDMIQSEQMNILKKNIADMEFSGLFTKFQKIIRKSGTGLLRNESEFSEIKKIFANKILKKGCDELYFQNKLNYYSMYLQYCLIITDYEKAYEYAGKVVTLIEDNIHMLNGKPEKYLYSLNNLLTCQTRTERFDEFEITALKLLNAGDKFPGKITEKNRVFAYYSYSILKIYNYFSTSGYTELKIHLAETEKNLPLYENKIQLNQRIIFYYSLCIGNFVLSDFDKCIYWTGKLISAERTADSQDYQCYSRIIQVISYFEAGYIDSLEYALKSAYHFISKMDRVYQYENIILKYLRMSFRIKTKSELTEMFKEMKNSLEKISKDPFEQNAFDAFNILYWLESKITGKPLTDIMKNKNLNRSKK